MRNIKLIGSETYALALDGVPIFRRGVEVEVDDKIAELALSRLDAQGQPYFCAVGLEAPKRVKIATRKPSSGEPFPVTI